MKNRKPGVIQLSGEYVLETTAEETWAYLIQPKILSACIKGCEEVILHGEGRYSAHFSFGFGPFKRTIAADLRVEEIAPPEQYLLVAELQTRKFGSAGGRAEVILVNNSDGCTLKYQADVAVTGWFDSFNEAVIRSAAGKTLAVFFDRFARITSDNRHK